MSVAEAAPKRLRVRDVPAGTAALAGIVVLAAVLRFATLTDQSYWYDEIVSVNLMRDGFGGMISGVHAHEATPPLYFIVAWLWTRVFGDGEAGLRSLSALAGTLTVPVAYLAARDLIGRRGALVTALLVAISPALIYYSQEARSYGLLELMSALTLLFFVRALQRPSTRNHALWAAMAAIALVTHYFSLFLIVPEAIWLLARGRDRRRAVLAVGAVALVGLALVPLAMYQRNHGGVTWIRLYPLRDRLEHVGSFFVSAGQELLPISWRGLVVAMLALFAAGAAIVWRSRNRYRAGALLALGLGVAAIALPTAAALLGSSRDYVLDRNVLPAWLPLAVAAAAAVVMMKQRRVALLMLAFACVVLLRFDYLMFSDSGTQRDDWRAVAHALGPPPQTGRIIVVAPSWEERPLKYYLPSLRTDTASKAVSEIDTVTYNGPIPGNLRGRTPVPSAPFRRVDTIHVQRMTLVRYRASRPAPVDPASLENLSSPPVVQPPT